LYSRGLSIRVLGGRVRFNSAVPSVLELLASNFETMAQADEDPHPDLEYQIRVSDIPETLSLLCREHLLLAGIEPCDLLFAIEKELVVELQNMRPDLFFLHSAAIEWKGKVCLLAADSGSGKSTTAWALLHHGFGYLSDELAPVDLRSMEVHPYPHALCLKQAPPPDYPLPAETIDLGRTLHVPVPALPTQAIAVPRPLGAVFLVKYRPDLGAPELRAIGAAEAAARLYLTALNALSHPNRGFDAAVAIAKHVPCFAINSADLPATCALIRSALGD
jgi:hypothetical protein